MTASEAAPDGQARRHPPEARRRALWAALVLALGAGLLLELCLGQVALPPGAVLDILLGREGPPESWRRIVLLFRLPRAVTALLAGASLGVAGLKMQTLFRNPLADPYVLGISAGAHLGVALLVLTAGGAGWTVALEKAGVLGNLSLIAASSLGAGTVLAVVLAVARRVRGEAALLIIGLMFGYITSSLVSVLMHFTLEQQLQSYIAWTFGSFSAVTWSQMRVFAPVTLAGLALAPALAKPLNALLLGPDYARSMGVDVRAVRLWIILGSALLAGGVTAYCGPVGFLGVAVPHLCRTGFRTADHRVLVPAVILTGALLALVADLASQAPGAATVLPLNAVTALIGAPVVVWVILGRRRDQEVGA
jgi:iron complex transport system permease protein